MNYRRIMTIVITAVLTLMCAAALAWADDDARALKKRFMERYPVLMALKDAGKVGETHVGMVDVVEARYRGEKAQPDDPKSPTIEQFVGQENQDREKLYRLIAEETDTTAEKVAERNAQRNEANAKPHHYLRGKDGVWVQKKNLKDRR